MNNNNKCFSCLINRTIWKKLIIHKSFLYLLKISSVLKYYWYYEYQPPDNLLQFKTCYISSFTANLFKHYFYFVFEICACHVYMYCLRMYGLLTLQIVSFWMILCIYFTLYMMFSLKYLMHYSVWYIHAPSLKFLYQSSNFSLF